MLKVEQRYSPPDLDKEGPGGVTEENRIKASIIFRDSLTWLNQSQTKLTMELIRVTAVPCNPEGNTKDQMSRVELKLNLDLVGAIQDNGVLTKQGPILHIGGSHFKDIQIADPWKVKVLR